MAAISRLNKYGLEPATILFYYVAMKDGKKRIFRESLEISTKTKTHKDKEIFNLTTLHILTSWQPVTKSNLTSSNPLASL